MFNKYIAAGFVALSTLAINANAQMSDPTTLATDAEGLFGTVSGITIAVVGFYILVKIVKKVTKS